MRHHQKCPLVKFCVCVQYWHQSRQKEGMFWLSLCMSRSILSYKSRLSLNSIVRQMRLACKSRCEKAETPPCEGRTLKRTPYNAHIASVAMSLCNVCRSIPFRKLINSGEAAVEEDGFKFNLVERTSPRFSDHLPWNERRCTISELVSRAKTCRLCAKFLSRIEQHRWVECSDGSRKSSIWAWEEAKTAISRNLMIWVALYPYEHHTWAYNIELGDPHRSKTLPLSFNLVKTLGKFHYPRYDDTKPDWVLKIAR